MIPRFGEFHLRKTAFLLLMLCSIVTTGAVRAEGELIPDYYEEPGAGNAEEVIDPFSGTLRLSYVDVHLPGNGGMDIDIRRVYNNLQDDAKWGVAGVGWKIQFGRVLITDGAKLCSVHGGPAENVLNNPVVELPDGSIKQLFYADSEPFQWISYDRWKADCIAGGSGIVLTSPEGLQYTMDYFQNLSGLFPLYAWYTTKITDRNGNRIDITYTYGGAFSSIFLVDTVSSPDGRLVEFNYGNLDDKPGGKYSDTVRLRAVTANGQTWTYGYTDIPGLAGPHAWLTSVTRPDGLQYNYSYYPFLTDGSAGSLSLQQITYPYGAISSFTYDYVQFDFNENPTTVVVNKTQSGPAIENGTWNYSYAPGSGTPGIRYDVTTISAPNGTYVLNHVGAAAGYYDDLLYAIGLPGNQDVYDLQGNLIQRTTYEWAHQVISNEKYFRPQRPSVQAPDTSAPVLVSKTVFRDGVNYETRYATFDDYLTKLDRYGNPLSQTETGNYATRATDLTYFHQAYGTDNWLIRQLKDEIVRDAGEVSGSLVDAPIIRTYSSAGNLLQENKYGVTTDFTYHSTGDVETTTNARGFTTTYSSYTRGVPQTENHPEGVTITRTVNATGTTASETNGRGYITGYTYDGLNRPTGADYPINSDTTITYNAIGRTLIRGSYQETTILDGLGRAVCIVKTDTQASTSITQQIHYNAVGQKVFESYPSDTATCSTILPPPGTTYGYDVLDRLTRITHADGTFRTYEYLTGNQVKETNERGYVTYKSFASFGDPDEKYLIRIDAPEEVSTVISVNKLGQNTSIWQGQTGGSGYDRTFSYDSRFFLTSVNNPETGLTLFERDAVGNMTSKQVGSSGITTYSYDGLDRLAFIDYPNTTPDVSYTYDKNSNVASVSNTNAQRTNNYDANDNLLSETALIGARAASIGYGYTDLDHLDTLTYPTGRTATYSPDAFGRATQVGPYATSISYYPAGQLRQLVYANGQTTDYTLDSRLRTERIQGAGTANAVDLTYAYDGASNIQSITDALEPSYSLTLGYDGIDRLTVANGSWGSGSITYDYMGNLKTKTIGSIDLSYTISNNKITRITGSSRFTFGYDVYGNVNSNNYFNFDYDDAGNMRAALFAGGGKKTGSDPNVYYEYDGNNMRVQRTDTQQTTDYLYAQNGNLLGEYGDVSANDKEYFYLGTRLVASMQGNPPPIADAGADQSIDEDTLVTLDGTASRDFYGSITSYSWLQTDGPTVTLSGGAGPTPSFTAPTAIYNAILTFELTVTNTAGELASDSVTVAVQMVDNDADGLSDFWESQYFGGLSTTPSGDEDGDGYTNLEEYRYGTDPLVAQPMDKVVGLIARPGNAWNTLLWAPVDRALTYDIYWSTTPGVTALNGTRISNGTSPFIHAGLTNGQTYYYVVVAANTCCTSTSSEAEVTTGMSGWSAPQDFVTRMGTNDARIATNDSGESMVIWSNSVTGEKSWVATARYSSQSGWSNYKIINSTDGISVAPAIAINNAGEAIAVWKRADTELSSGGNYYFELWARLYSPSTGWAAPVRLQEVTSLNNGDQINFDRDDVFIDEQGNATILWSKSGDSVNHAKVFAKRYVSGNGWGSTNAIVDADPFPTSLSTPRFSANRDGLIIGAWKTYRTEIVNSSTQYVLDEVKAIRYQPTTGWSNIETVRQLPSYPVVLWENNYDDFNVAINATGQVAVSWDQRERDLNGSDISYRVLVAADNGDGWLSTEVPPGQDAFLNSLRGPHDTAIDNGGVVSVAMVGQMDGDGPNYIGRYNSVAGVWEGRVHYANTNDLHYIALDSNENPLMYETDSNVENRNGNVISYAAIVYPYRIGRGIRVPDIINTADNYFSGGTQLTVGENGNNLLLLNDTDSTQTSKISYYTAVPGAPVADAGINRRVEPNTNVVLDGTGSVDNDGSIVSYQWRQIHIPTTNPYVDLALQGADTATPSFVTPITTYDRYRDDEYAFELLVADNEGLISIDTVRIKVSGENQPPVADAGFNQIIMENTVANLDGNGSYDPGGTIVSYAWQQIAGAPVMLQNGNTVTPSFTAPDVTADTVLTFELIVTDNDGGTATDTVDITVQDIATIPPTADTGPDQTVTESDSVFLDGSGSTDSDGFIASYSWVQTGGQFVTLNNPATASPSFIAPLVDVAETLTFELTVTDDANATGTDTVNITVQDAFSGDTTPPVTTAQLSRNVNKGKVSYDVTFTVDEPATTYFRVTGDGTVTSGGQNTTTWQTYTGPITVAIAKNGAANLDYYSVDTAGNQETTRTEVLQ